MALTNNKLQSEKQGQISVLKDFSLILEALFAPFPSLVLLFRQVSIGKLHSPFEDTLLPIASTHNHLSPDSHVQLDNSSLSCQPDELQNNPTKEPFQKEGQPVINSTFLPDSLSLLIEGNHSICAMLLKPLDYHEIQCQSDLRLLRSIYEQENPYMRIVSEINSV